MKSSENEKISSELTVGAMLKNARAQKKISLEELAGATSVPMRDLERLETGDYDHLPAEIYVRSFLERCARELNIEANALADLYQKEAVNSKNRKEVYAPAAPKSKKFIITPKFLIVAVSAIGAVLLVFYFWYQLSNLLKPPFLVVENPASDIITSEETISVSGQTQKDSHIFINGREIEVNADGFFNDNFHLEPGVNLMEIKSVNRFKKESVLIKRVIKQ